MPDRKCVSVSVDGIECANSDIQAREGDFMETETLEVLRDDRGCTHDQYGRYLTQFNGDWMPINRLNRPGLGVKAGDVVQMTFIFTDTAPGGGTFQFHRHYNVIKTGSDTETLYAWVQRHVLAVKNAWNGGRDPLKAEYGLLTTFSSVHVNGITDPTEETSYSVGVRGSGITEALPPRTAPVIRKYTSLRGRSYQGRNYLPRMTEGTVTSGQLNAGAMAAITAFFDQTRFVGPANNPFGAEAVYSPTLSVGGMIVSNSVQRTLVNPYIGTVRRRFRRLSTQ